MFCNLLKCYTFRKLVCNFEEKSRSSNEDFSELLLFLRKGVAGHEIRQSLRNPGKMKRR